MNPYEFLASAYDGLTCDINYSKICGFMETVLHALGRQPKTLLDLACGTGSVSVLLSQRGYRVIGADISEEMLTVAAQKAAQMTQNAPYFVHQKMQKLHLPERVDSVVCLLDSLNYLTDPEDCKQTFRRVFSALNDGGVFFFDINTPDKLHALDGQVFLDENEESYCVWRAEFDEGENCCYYGIDLFQREGELWQRSFEQHCEYAYDPQALCMWLREIGFTEVRLYGDCALREPTPTEQRIYFAALKGSTT